MIAAELMLSLAGPGADEVTLLSLLDEIDNVSDARAERLEGAPAPDGSKALGIDTMTLIVKAGVAVLPKLVGSLVDWLTRQPQGTKLRVEHGDEEFEWEGPMPPAEILELLTRSRT